MAENPKPEIKVSTRDSVPRGFSVTGRGKINNMAKKFYITTAIDYVNAPPHIGHALEKIQADVLARYHRKLNEDVFFLTGSDENSLKNVQAAKKEKISIQELVSRNSLFFKSLGSALNLSFDQFIRTTEEKHIQGSQKLWTVCQKEDIYKKRYQGLYCLGCEMFLKESELVNGLCPEHKTKPDLVQEENYFFRLSKYQKDLEKIIESDQLEIIPQTRKNETLSFIKSGLEDFSISRSAQRAEGWGVPVPGDPSQILYVWFDALANYITALNYVQDRSTQFQKYWPADFHCIGKGILRFHAIYWPAMLLSAGLPLPKKIFVHGYLTIEGQKISKSLGNVVDPFELVRKYGADPVRYYFLREFASTEDGDFSIKRLEDRYNADLANGLGNLVSRVLTLSEKSGIKNQEFPNPKQNKLTAGQAKIKNEQIIKEINSAQENYRKALDQIKFHEALESIWQLISFCDEYIEKNKPWQLIKEQKTKGKEQKLKEILSDLLVSLEEIASLLEPFLPETSQKIVNQLQKNKKTEVLFPRL